MTDMNNNLDVIIKAAVIPNAGTNSDCFEPSQELNAALKKKLANALKIQQNKSSYIKVWVCSLVLTLIACAVVLWFVTLSITVKALLAFVLLIPCFFGVLLVLIEKKEELS